MNPLVSIIIPVFNREVLIHETLKSIKSQTYENWECIIVDDHSTDHSISIIENFIRDDFRFTLFSRPCNTTKGANSCRNYGFEKCKGDYVNWFDSDDIMHADFISKKIKTFSRNDDAVISKTKMFSKTIDNVIGQENRASLSNNLLEDFITLKIKWYLPDLMWRKSFLLNKKLFDVDLKAGQDYDFHIRMLLQNPKLKVVDEYLTYYRKHEDNITGDLAKKNNFPLLKSIMINAVEQVNMLFEKNKMTNELKLFYFKTVIKYLPFLYKDKESLKTLITLLNTLTYFNFKILINWTKFRFALITLKLFGKGGKLLR